MTVVITCEPVLRTGATALIGLAIAAAPARANPASIVVSAVDYGESGAFLVEVDYAYSLESALITRESVGDPVDPLDAIPRHKDLSFQQFKHTLTPRLELGIYRDLWVSFAAPVVITQARELELADGVARESSSTISDGLVPAQGFDGRDPGSPLAGDGVFRGQARKGIDQLHFGLGVAPMNQRRDPTKPTWKIGAEVRLAVGQVMRFDQMRLDEQNGVSKGVHELKLWTSMAKRYARTEAWFDVFWQVPLSARENSLFDDMDDEPFGATNLMLGQRAGIGFGLETYAVDDAINRNRISLDLGTRITANFEGRDYTEMWELFAFAGDARGGGPLVLDRDPTNMGVQSLSHPGITNFENHLELTGRAAVRAQLGPHARFAAMIDLVWKTDHAITFSDAGIDLDTCPNSAPACEDDANDLVNPGTREVNPLHVPGVDLVGHRYHSENNFTFVIGVEGQLLF